MTLRQTHTFAVLEVSAPAYDEIKAKLLAADYKHAFIDDKIDMHGIGLARGEPKERVFVHGSEQPIGPGSGKEKVFVVGTMEPGGPGVVRIHESNDGEDTAQGDLRNVLQILLGLKDPAYGGDGESRNIVIRRETLDRVERRIQHALERVER